ncbi:uncharacterized protein SPAPADRAFT_61541 [Spathaspora passalidarum NRRL Y-27907]|uniref:Uncharacterized protein n=1 Tax=Spathaspora passalidarum (strain NRRL Y-27907 / 11-Y1) TaxID=619300 RepID=G3AN89_SPAPN|nr:uncharacterized protein SPAPADRAFT_61541 [Spathaspora passalidarum NRRL Y-27907]EGW32472.1 hypothetical protein SPAPADRAFT_61541 [Spathaspora passalidarum NRRL Y-27907]
MSEQTTPVPRTRRVKQQSPYEVYIKPYVTPKLKKDLSFGLVGFLGMCVGIFHYAYIMKEWLMNPYMENTKLAIHFAGFFLHVFVSIYFYLFKYYPVVYAEEIAEEQAELEELRKKDAEIKSRKNQ